MRKKTRGVIGWVALGILLGVVVLAPLIWIFWWWLKLGGTELAELFYNWSFSEMLEIIFILYQDFFYDALFGNLLW